MKGLKYRKFQALIHSEIYDSLMTLKQLENEIEWPTKILHQ